MVQSYRAAVDQNASQSRKAGCNDVLRHVCTYAQCQTNHDAPRRAVRKWLILKQGVGDRFRTAFLGPRAPKFRVGVELVADILIV